MIPFKTPEGPIWIKPSEVVAILACELNGKNQTTVRSQIWLSGIEDPFNLLEDVVTTREEIQKALTGFPSAA